MPSTYSTSLRLELMADGEKSGTWGTITNTNLGTLIEQGVAGVASVAHDDSASYTLTTNNGSSDEARNAVVLMTGALTADREVIVPDVDKVYIFKNGTSGGFALTFKTSGGSGVTIPNGRAAICYVDSGTGTVNAIDDGYFTDSIYIEGSSAGDFITAESTNAGATSGPDIKLYRNSASPADSDVLSKITFTANTDDGAGGVSVSDVEYASINVSAPETNETSGEAGKMVIALKRGGTTQNYIEIQGGTSADADNDSIVFKTGGSTVMTIDNSQNVIIANDLTVDTDTLYVDSANNRVGIGEASPTQTLHVDSGTEGEIAKFNTTKSFSSGNQNTFQILNPNMTGGATGLVLGKAGSTYNAAKIIYSHSGDGSDSNYIGIGLWDADGLIRLSNSGTIVNEVAADRDFRIESVSNDHMLFVDAGLNQVRVGSGTNNAPSTYPFISYAGDTSGRSAFVHAAGDGGVVISGSAGGSQAALIMGNNWGTNGATFSEEWRILMNGTDDSLNFNYNANASTALTLSSSGVATFGGDLLVPEYIQHSGDSNTYFGFPGGDQFAIITAGQNRLKFVGSESVFNEDEEDKDFRVASVNNANMLIVDAAADQVRIGQSSSSTPSSVATLYVKDGVTTDYSGQFAMSYQAGTYTDYYKGMTGLDLSTSVARGLHLFNYDNDSDAGINFWSGRPTVGTPVLMATFGPSNVIFNDNGADRDFRVESTGNPNMLLVDAADDTVYIGTNINVFGAADAYGMNLFAAGIANFSTNDASIHYWNIENLSTTRAVVTFYATRSSVGNISISTSGTTYNTTSDRRLKDNIEPIADGTEKLMAMKPITHTWKADPEADAVHGFIAQEMMDVVPEAVTGDPDGEEMMQMDYGRITPVLVAALQDAHNKIAALEERLTELEAK